MNNNPSGFASEHFNANPYCYSTFNSYLAFYQHGVEVMFKRVADGPDTPNMIAMPFLFLARHSLELGYKFCLFHLSSLVGETYTASSSRHNLAKLHKDLGELVQKASEMGAVSRTAEDGFSEYYQKTETAMLWFDSIDKNGTLFRYPENDERPVFDLDARINLLEVKEKFDEAMILLTTLIDVITHGQG